MLGMYLDTLLNRSQLLLSINKHYKRTCKMSWLVICYGQKSKNTTTITKKIIARIEAGNPCTLVWSVTSGPPRQLSGSIAVKLFNCLT